jgi:outer membrane lipoprotein-sorting protein
MAGGKGGIKVVDFWSSGAKFRSESVLNGHPVVTIVSGDTYYAYDALRMEGVAIRRSKAAIAADSPDHRPFGNEFETLRRQGAEKVREEKIVEIPCDVYQLTNEAGRRIVWVSQKSGLPLRLEIYDRQSGVTKYREFFNWRTNILIHDEFFRPDPAVQLKRINFDEYLTAMSSEDSAIPIPILFGELLKGPDS